MRNKEMCLKCKYHSFFEPTPKNVKKSDLKNVICYYSVFGNQGPALKRNGPSGVIDTRGEGSE